MGCSLYSMLPGVFCPGIGWTAFSCTAAAASRESCRLETPPGAAAAADTLLEPAVGNTPKTEGGPLATLSPWELLRFVSNILTDDSDCMDGVLSKAATSGVGGLMFKVSGGEGAPRIGSGRRLTTPPPPPQPPTPPTLVATGALMF